MAMAYLSCIKVICNFIPRSVLEISFCLLIKDNPVLFYHKRPFLYNRFLFYATIDFPYPKNFLWRDRNYNVMAGHFLQHWRLKKFQDNALQSGGIFWQRKNEKTCCSFFAWYCLYFIIKTPVFRLLLPILVPTKKCDILLTTIHFCDIFALWGASTNEKAATPPSRIPAFCRLFNIKMILQLIMTFIGSFSDYGYRPAAGQLRDMRLLTLLFSVYYLPVCFPYQQPYFYCALIHFIQQYSLCVFYAS